MDTWISGEAEAEHSNGSKNGAEHAGIETRFGRRLAMFGAKRITNVKLRPYGLKTDADDHPNSDAYESQAGQFLGEAMTVRENDREGVD